MHTDNERTIISGDNDKEIFKSIRYSAKSNIGRQVYAKSNKHNESTIISVNRYQSLSNDDDAIIDDIEDNVVENIPPRIRSSKRKESKNNRNVYVLGDSLVRPIKGYDIKKELNKNESVFVKCFHGAAIKDTEHYAVPSLSKDPPQVFLHIGTNSLPLRVPKL